MHYWGDQVEYLFNHLAHIGVSGRVPFLGGGSASLGVSWQDGQLDAGLIFEGDIPAVNAGKMLGKASVEAGYQPGNGTGSGLYFIVFAVNAHRA